MPSTPRSGRAPRGSASLERDVHGHGAVLHAGIDAHHPAGDDAVARVHLGGQAEREIARLDIRDLEHRLQPLGRGDARERLAGLDPLAGLEVELLHLPRRAGAHLHRGDPLLLEAGDRAQALAVGAPEIDLSLERLVGDGEAALFHLVALVGLGQAIAGAVQVHRRGEPLLREPLGHRHRALGLAALGARGAPAPGSGRAAPSRGWT